MALSCRIILCRAQNIQHSDTFLQNVLSKTWKQNTLFISSKALTNCKNAPLHLQPRLAFYNKYLSCLYSGRLSNRCLHMSALYNSRQKTMKSSSSIQSEHDVSSSDRLTEVNVRLSAENGYLSWMRNTYIMTLAGVTMMASQVGSLTPVAGVAAFLCAGLNMTVGSAGYIYNLEVLKRQRVISKFSTLVSQILVLLHLMLWCSVLIVFLPDIQVTDIIDNEMDDK